MENKELAIHLLREEVRNKRLMHSLEELGFDCTVFTLNVGSVILKLIGFDHIPDELSSRYCDLVEKALEETTFWNLEKMLEKWPKIIYKELLEIKPDFKGK
jgi:tRNA(His) 5'-end guanylyltransferase